MIESIAMVALIGAGFWGVYLLYAWILTLLLEHFRDRFDK